MPPLLKFCPLLLWRGNAERFLPFFWVKIGEPDIIMIICSTHQPFWSSCRLCAGKFTGYIWLSSPDLLSSFSCQLNESYPNWKSICSCWRWRTLVPHCVHPLHSTSHPLNLILKQQTQLSVAGNRSDIAVLPKKVGKLAKVEMGQKGRDKFGKAK